MNLDSLQLNSNSPAAVEEWWTMPDFEDIQYVVEESAAIITINRP